MACRADQTGLITSLVVRDMPCVFAGERLQPDAGCVSVKKGTVYEHGKPAFPRGLTPWADLSRSSSEGPAAISDQTGGE